MICGSETGAVAYDEGRVLRKGRIAPGQIFCVDTTRGVIMDDEEITQKFAARRPYDRWVQENLVQIDSLAAQSSGSAPASPTNGGNGHTATIHNSIPLSNRQASFGYTSEEIIVVLRPMLTTGHEPVGAMGDDTPPAVMSKLPRPLFSYFKQRFAEVTNPPIDPLREEMVMSPVSYTHLDVYKRQTRYNQYPSWHFLR